MNGDAISFNRELPHWFDVTVFTDCIASNSNRTEPSTDPTILQESLNLYVGEFLAGFQIEGAPQFERWMYAQRIHLHDLFIQGLRLRTQQHMAAREYAEGLALNHHLLTLEPWREEVHQQRMILLAYSGQRTAALKQYDLCCQTLKEELDVPPMEQTITLYEQIKSGQWFDTQTSINHRHNMSVAITPYPEAVWEQPLMTPAPLQMTSPTSQEPQRYRLNVELGTMPEPTHFYGRETELATLRQWINEEQCRLVTIEGSHGQGKTALSAAFVQEIIATQPKNAATGTEKSNVAESPAHDFTVISWHSLHGAPSCMEILQGWLYQLMGEQRTELPLAFDHLISQLFDILQEQRCLLVLDGVEEILTLPNEDGDECLDCYHSNLNAYTTLFRLFFQRRHQSCLLLTSRIRSVTSSHLDGQHEAVRSLHLMGLSAEDADSLLTMYNIPNVSGSFRELHQRYGGNPLLMKRAAGVICDLFDHDITSFLQERFFYLGDIGTVPAEQLAQLSTLEKKLLQLLVLAEQPLTRETLWENLLQEPSAKDSLIIDKLSPKPAKQNYFSALQKLQRTFFIYHEGSQIKIPEPFEGFLMEYTV
ncbi:MAG: BTAD domain-containing putative transcriptional regulator [Chloroflexota bacterium]